MGDRPDWPTYEELRDAGRTDLAWAVASSGGSTRWAREFGRNLRSIQKREKRRWTRAAIEGELRRFLGDAPTFPEPEAFAEAGHSDLYAAVRRTGGVNEWCQRLGLPPKTIRWTDELLESELRSFLVDTPDWPTRSEFKAAGRSELYRAVMRHGGVAVWAPRLEKKLSSRQRHPTLRARGPS
jgi:hypothetical protein